MTTCLCFSPCPLHPLPAPNAVMKNSCSKLHMRSDFQHFNCINRSREWGEPTALPPTMYPSTHPISSCLPLHALSSSLLPPWTPLGGLRTEASPSPSMSFPSAQFSHLPSSTGLAGPPPCSIPILGSSKCFSISFNHRENNLIV